LYEEQEVKNIASAVLWCFKKEYMIAIGFMLIREFFDLLQPYIFTKTLEHLKNDKTEDHMTGFLLAFALFASVVCFSLFHEHGCDEGFKIGRSSQQVI
jgi:ABC-type multidrug transport system fused ATPase/permease subunit